MKRAFRDFEPWEFVLIRAANELDGKERMEAIADIAAMSGRGVYGVRIKAARVRREDSAKLLETCLAHQSAGVVDRGRGPNKIKEPTGHDIDLFPETGVP